MEGDAASSLGPSLRFLQYVKIWRVIPSAVVGPLCLIEYKVGSAISQEILVNFKLNLC